MTELPRMPMKVFPGKTGRIRYDWWRAHHGLPGHPKWRAVARAAQVPVSVAFHIAVCLLDTASRGKPRGSIGDFKPFDCAGIVNVSVDKVDRVVGVLREIHWLEGHMIAEWDGRQPQREDIHAAKRAAEYRLRNESVTTRRVTPANAPDREEDITSSESGTARARAAAASQDSRGKNLATPQLEQQLRRSKK